MMEDSKLLAAIQKDTETSFDFQQRKHAHWNENYLLTRDKVILNRITQRQSINLPIMKETMGTWVSKTDEAPILNFETRQNGIAAKRNEIAMNEVWMHYYDLLSLDLLDNLEKKIVFLQGRSFKRLGYSKGQMFCDVVDPFDIDIDPKVNVLDIETASFINHKNIFRPLREILANKSYDEAQKRELNKYLDTRDGIIQSANTKEALHEKQVRLELLGVHNFDDFGASDVIVGLKHCYKMLWVSAEKRFVRHLVVVAADNTILLKKPCKQAIGIDESPFTSWADDPDLNDIWSDGKGDNVRTINKALNIWVSQMLENRTFRNFQMNFYDSTNQKFNPQTFDPRPFGMYPVPGKPSEVIQAIPVQPLSDSINEMNFLTGLAERSTGITATEKGVPTKGSNTLGEIQIDLRESTARIATTAKNYRRAWMQFGEKFYKMQEANASGKMTLHKKGPDGKNYPKDLYPKDYLSKDGYKVVVTLKTEKDNKDNDMLKKNLFVKSQFMNNPVVQKIADRKTLELVGWTPEEVDEAMKAQGQIMQSPAAMIPPGAKRVESMPSGMPTREPINA